MSEKQVPQNIPGWKIRSYRCFTCKHFMYLEKHKVKCALREYLDKPLTLCNRYEEGLSDG